MGGAWLWYAARLASRGSVENDSDMKRTDSRVAQKAGALVAAVSLALGACGGATPKPTVVNITSPTPNAQLDVGRSSVIKGVVTGENIVRVDVLINGKLYASASSGDAAKVVGEMPVDGIAWTPATAGTHAIEFRVFGPNEQLLVRSDPVVITARGQVAAQPTSAPVTTTPQAVPTVANPGAGNATAAPPASTGPSVTVSNDFVNVREGPNTAYRLLGRLEQGQTVPVRGKSADGLWWQISFAQGAGGVGWVFGELVTANSAAGGVPVASAPPLPTQPPPPPPVVQPTATTAPPPPVATGPKTVGNLTVDREVVPPNGTVNVSWNVQGIQRADFDKGDGSGYQPAGGTMAFAVPGIVSNRQIRLKITYNDGRVTEDTITIRVDASAVGGSQPPPSEQECNASNPLWKESQNPDYKFCVRKDMEFVGDTLNLMSFGAGTDKTFRMSWDVFGIAGIRWRLFGSAALGCPAGPTVNDLPVPGATDNHTFNIKDLGRGGYKIQLSIQRRDGGTTNYNEKVFCIR